MGIEAKPPIRRGPGAGTILLWTLLAAFIGGSVLFGASVVGLRMFGRSDSTNAVAGTMSSDFSARLTAAQRIYGNTERDEALRTLATKYAVDSAEATAAIREIRTNEARDWAAWDVARRFSETNQSHHAVAVAELIQTRSISDSASRAIATGEWPDAPGSRYVSELSVFATETVGEGVAH